MKKHRFLLTWNKRYPKRDRPRVLALIHEVYPEAEDLGEAVSIPVEEEDTKPVWMFLFWKCWKDIDKRSC